MLVLSAEFRGFAAQTHQENYKNRLLQAAVELDREVARLEGHYLLTLAS